jgi:hypothetical protein
MKPRLILRVALGALALALAVLASSCGGTKNVGTLGNFSMNFTGFTPHLGMTFYLRLVDTTNHTTVSITTPTTITGDAFSVTLPSTITEGHTYDVDFWVDVDGNGTLDHSPSGTPAGVDHSWRKTGTGTAAGLSMTFAHDTNWTDITPWP